MDLAEQLRQSIIQSRIPGLGFSSQIQRAVKMDTATDGKTLLQIAVERSRLRVDLDKSTTQPAETIRPSVVGKPDTRTAEERAADNLRWDEEKRQRAVEYRRQRRLEQWAGGVGAQIGPDYAAADLANWRYHGTPAEQHSQRDVVAAVKHYLDELRANVEGGRNLVILGPMGSGKDFLLAVAMKFAVLQWGQHVVWQNGTQMYARFRDSMNSDADCSESYLLRTMIEAPILAISDPLPPSGGLTEFQASTAFTIIDGRYRARRPTWLTINALSRSEVQGRMGSQNADRLAHRSLGLFCNWGSFRELEHTEAAQ